ncbi:MAG: alpha-glucan family phosphorylase [Candidatus Hydrogenedentes bacterium]|nr:alpha-glucan family phosphorylase [Candidatus Hydrogenedentota bacterium]
MKTAERLRELARNLYWTWHPEIIGIFRDIDPELWRDVNHNPVAFLKRLPDETLLARGAELAIDTRITHAFHQLNGYLAARATWGARAGGPTKINPVAYFSAEFGLHESLPIYSGGMGVLAGDHLQAASDLGIPLVGIGLYYAYGYFKQRLDKNGWQQEEYLEAEVENLPIEVAKDNQGEPLRIAVENGATKTWARVWCAEVGRCTLILLDTNIEENSKNDQGLTAQLYGGDEYTRIRQELILGVGGIRALEALGIRPSVIHLNEGHSAFATLEAARQIIAQEERPFEEVKERIAKRTVFTTHTPVQAGHDRFPPDILLNTLNVERKHLGISEKDLLALGRVNPQDDGEPFCMTVLGLKMSRYRNAVSAIHERVSRKMWQGLWPSRPLEEIPIYHITNGVHTTTWLAMPMARLYSRHHGENWAQRAHLPDTWAGIEEVDNVEFWEQHQILKANLVDYVRRCVGHQHSRRGDKKGAEEATHKCLDYNVLTIGFARRFAAYKRATLLFGDLERLDRLVNNQKRPIQFIFAGKAHPNDEGGKKLAKQVYEVTQMPEFKGKIVFIEDHDINVSRHLVQGVDVWLNNPRRPREACGTSGQKVVLNGGLNLSVLDGWWAEAYDGFNGFAIGAGEEHSDPERQDNHDRESLFSCLENEVAPLFYKCDSNGIPDEWIARQKHAIRTLPWRFNASRMVIDYMHSCYLPATGTMTSTFPGTEATRI